MAKKSTLRIWLISVLVMMGAGAFIRWGIFVVGWVRGTYASSVTFNRQVERIDHLSSNIDGRDKPPSANPPGDPTTLARDLDSDDADLRQEALRQINELALTDPKSLALNLPQWIAPLLRTRQFDELEQITLTAILERSFDPVIVQKAQSARVKAFIGKGDYSRAMKEAKSYYNIAAISETAEAVDLLTQILRRTNDPITAAAFKADQMQPGTGSTLLASIEVDPSPYADAIQAIKRKQNGNRGLSHNSLQALGNLLLLTNQAYEAKDYFEAACRTESASGQSLRQAMEGVAEAIRAEDGNVAAADTFITSVRQRPSEAGISLTTSAFTSWEELRITAQEIVLSKLQSASLPPIEQERANEEGALASASPPKVISGFEGSSPIHFALLSPTHLVVEITTPGFRDWFMFQVQGVAGKTVRIDITGAYKTVPDWSQKAWSINPVYACASSLDDPAAFSMAPTASHTIATNGTILPTTPGQSWQYISDTWSDEYTLSFVKHFDSESAFIAMRVPRTATFNEKYLRGLKASPFMGLAQIGRSSKGRPLLLAQIGSTSQDKPCILIYAGEHPDEYDAGWAAQGAIDCLVSDSPAAVDLRKRYTFLVIPLLDPDASAAGIHQSILSSFLPQRTTKESIAYAGWFQNWVDSGNRLDVAIDLHNIQSGEGPHVFCPLIESSGIRGSLSLALHKLILTNIQNAGYGVQLNPQMRGWMPDRLCGWLSHYYGTLSIAYEINSQAPERHLSLAETTALGGIFARSVGEFLQKTDGSSLLANVDIRRRQRANQLAEFAKPIAAGNAIVSEADLLKYSSAVNEIESSETKIP